MYTDTTFMIARICAPAKINLHLEVFSRREDGFHDLMSIFQSVSLEDTIVVETASSGDEIAITGDFPFPGNQNIMYKAAALFREKAGIRASVHISAEKQIPIGAGLGGGSSDASAVIDCLAALFPGRLSGTEISNILKTLGSDVPYFYKGAAALVSGRGEIVETLEPRTDFHVIIIYPGFGVGTKQAYESLDRLRAEGEYTKDRGKKEEAIGKNELLAMYFSTELSNFRFFNSFMEVVQHQYPEITRILEFIHKTDAFYANITGSGSGIFGLYREKEQALNAFDFFQKKSLFVFLAKPLDKKPFPVLQ